MIQPKTSILDPATSINTPKSRSKTCPGTRCVNLAPRNDPSIPAVKLFLNGGVADEFVGALPERDIQRFLDQALPSPNATRLEQSEKLLRERAYTEAARILQGIVDREGGNLRARTLLAEALLTPAP